MSFLYVTAYHGPCDTNNSKIHKPQKLTGIRDRLRRLGFRMDLVPVQFDSYCMLEMCGFEVFRCKIENLKFNTVCERDPVGQRAVEAVVGAAVKFRRARGTLWFWTLLDNQLFRRSVHAPIDYWATEIDDTGNKNICLRCRTCCDQIHRKPESEEDAFYRSRNIMRNKPFFCAMY